MLSRGQLFTGSAHGSVKKVKSDLAQRLAEDLLLCIKSITHIYCRCHHVSESQSEIHSDKQGLSLMDTLPLSARSPN